MKIFGGLSLAEALGEQLEYELPEFGAMRRLAAVTPPPSAQDYAAFAKQEPSAAAVLDGYNTIAKAGGIGAAAGSVVGMALGAAASRYSINRVGFVLSAATLGLAYGAVGYSVFVGPKKSEMISASHKFADYLESSARQV